MVLASLAHTGKAAVRRSSHVSTRPAHRNHRVVVREMALHAVEVNRNVAAGWHGDPRAQKQNPMIKRGERGDVDEIATDMANKQASKTSSFTQHLRTNKQKKKNRTMAQVLLSLPLRLAHLGSFLRTDRVARGRQHGGNHHGHHNGRGHRLGHRKSCHVFFCLLVDVAKKKREGKRRLVLPWIRVARTREAFDTWQHRAWDPKTDGPGVCVG